MSNRFDQQTLAITINGANLKISGATLRNMALEQLQTYPQCVAFSGQLVNIAKQLCLSGNEEAINANEVRPFTEKQISLLSTFADQSAIAIENVRLFNETTRLLQETEQHNRELSIINSVQEVLASKLDMQAIHELIGEKLGEVFKVEVIEL